MERGNWSKGAVARRSRATSRSARAGWSSGAARDARAGFAPARFTGARRAALPSRPTLRPPRTSPPRGRSGESPHRAAARRLRRAPGHRSRRRPSCGRRTTRCLSPWPCAACSVRRRSPRSLPCRAPCTTAPARRAPALLQRAAPRSRRPRGRSGGRTARRSHGSRRRVLVDLVALRVRRERDHRLDGPGRVRCELQRWRVEGGGGSGRVAGQPLGPRWLVGRGLCFVSLRR